MKQYILLMALFLCAITIEARGAIVYSAGEEIEEVMDLPHTNEFMIQASDGNLYYSKVGIMHKQFSLFWIPLINYGEEKYVLYVDQKIGKYDYTYSELSDEDIMFLHDRFGLSEIPSLSFWDAWGGKLLFLVIIFLLGGNVRGKKVKSNE